MRPCVYRAKLDLLGMCRRPCRFGWLKWVKQEWFTLRWWQKRWSR